MIFNCFKVNFILFGVILISTGMTVSYFVVFWYYPHVSYTHSRYVSCKCLYLLMYLFLFKEVSLMG